MPSPVGELSSSSITPRIENVAFYLAITSFLRFPENTKYQESLIAQLEKIYLHLIEEKNSDLLKITDALTATTNNHLLAIAETNSELLNKYRKESEIAKLQQAMVSISENRAVNEPSAYLTFVLLDQHRSLISILKNFLQSHSSEEFTLRQETRFLSAIDKKAYRSFDTYAAAVFGNDDEREKLQKLLSDNYELLKTLSKKLLQEYGDDEVMLQGMLNPKTFLGNIITMQNPGSASFFQFLLGGGTNDEIITSIWEKLQANQRKRQQAFEADLIKAQELVDALVKHAGSLEKNTPTAADTIAQLSDYKFNTDNWPVILEVLQQSHGDFWNNSASLLKSLVYLKELDSLKPDTFVDIIRGIRKRFAELLRDKLVQAIISYSISDPTPNNAAEVPVECFSECLFYFDNCQQILKELQKCNDLWNSHINLNKAIVYLAKLKQPENSEFHTCIINPIQKRIEMIDHITSYFFKYLEYSESSKPLPIPEQKFELNEDNYLLFLTEVKEKSDSHHYNRNHLKKCCSSRLQEIFHFASTELLKKVEESISDMAQPSRTLATH